jgi:4-hydroxy-3-methylbut-2-enyl diphosphate reductase
MIWSRGKAALYRPRMSETADKQKRPRVNVRRPDVMTQVNAEVERHYRSSIVEKIRENGGEITIGNTTVRLAQQFGFCYGVERAIDLAYAARRVFPDQKIFLIGEIIHNPEVNRQLVDMGIVSLPWKELTDDYDRLDPEDVVIVPAFGAPTNFMEKIEQRGCYVVDTTCGDVMKVWRRVRGYAKEGITSIIHGKAGHEETQATASRAMGDDGKGHYLIVLTLDETDAVCRYIREGGDKEAFLKRFAHAASEGFDPDLHLAKVGVANQTTMLKSETEEIQRRVRAAVEARDGSAENFIFFDTICGATQERQDALFEMLRRPMDMLFVVGGYNSSNTTHLVEIGEQSLPTFFIRNAECLESLEQIVHFDLHEKSEISSSYPSVLLGEKPVVIGITAGASCPNNLIEDTIFRIFEMRGVARETVKGV